MNGFLPTQHAVNQYRLRFAGNVSYNEAYRRLRKISKQVRRYRTAKGGAIAYRVDRMEMIVRDGRIITVYRADTRAHDGYALES